MFISFLARFWNTPSPDKALTPLWPKLHYLPRFYMSRKLALMVSGSLEKIQNKPSNIVKMGNISSRTHLAMFPITRQNRKRVGSSWITHLNPNKLLSTNYLNLIRIGSAMIKKVWEKLARNGKSTGIYSHVASNAAVEKTWHGLISSSYSPQSFFAFSTPKIACRTLLL
jgi:hypothetical protein